MKDLKAKIKSMKETLEVREQEMVWTDLMVKWFTEVEKDLERVMEK